MLTALIDLVSFSGILYSIYPDLFAVVVAYAGFGTGGDVGRYRERRGRYREMASSLTPASAR